jgi:hypothetical protein
LHLAQKIDAAQRTPRSGQKEVGQQGRAGPGRLTATEMGGHARPHTGRKANFTQQAEPPVYNQKFVAALSDHVEEGLLVRIQR